MQVWRCAHRPVVGALKRSTFLPGYSTRQITASIRPHLTSTIPSTSTTSIKPRSTRSHPTKAMSSAAAAAAATDAAPASPTATTVPATDAKINRLREIFATADSGEAVHALIVPSEDPHMSEYPPECDARRAFISGFDGSAGTAVITTEAAALWTDGRYFLQAEAQLGPDWTLMRAGVPGVPDIPEWLCSTLPEGARIAIDPTLHTIESAEKLRHQLALSGKVLVPLDPHCNPIDTVWGDQRPAKPAAPLRIHALRWAGRTPAEKIEDARKEIAAAGAGALVVTMLDEVAWLLNLRGADVAFNPVFLAYVVITAEEALLYIDQGKIGPDVAAHLKEAGVTVRPYDKAFADVAALASKGTKIWMDPSKVSFAMKTAAVNAAVEAGIGAAPGEATPQATNGGAGGASSSRKRARNAASNGASASASGVAASPDPTAAARAVVFEKPSPVYLAKAIKNEAELEGMREAHLRDGVALAKLFSHLDRKIAAEGGSMTECEIDEVLTAYRAAQQGFIEASFPTIAGAGPNGAIIHYRPHPDTCRTCDPNTLLLLDSGGQYDCGTTDVTRTVHMGTPTEHQRRCFTAVLKGHIALDAAVWPEGTPGCALDTLVRTPLWKMGLNFRHGTGHGVGAALNVHEGPQSISHRFGNTQPLLPAMVCSNEPGYYEDNAFGIRVENLFVIVEAPTAFRFGGQSYYTCERLTLVPLQKKMMMKEEMSSEEIAWVDKYHADVWAAVAPRLEAEGAAEELAWLKEACAPM